MMTKVKKKKKIILANLWTPSLLQDSLVLHVVPTGQPVLDQEKPKSPN